MSLCSSSRAPGAGGLVSACGSLCHWAGPAIGQMQARPHSCACGTLVPMLWLSGSVCCSWSSCLGLCGLNHVYPGRAPEGGANSEGIESVRGSVMAAGPGDCSSGRLGKAGQSWTWSQGLRVSCDKDAAGRHLLPPCPFSGFPGSLPDQAPCWVKRPGSPPLGLPTAWGRRQAGR